MSWSYSTTACAALALLAAIIIAKRVRGFFLLRHIPGPFWAGWTDLWMISGQLSGRMQLVLGEADSKYGGGKLTRIAPSWVICTDPAELRRIWGVRSSWRRGDWYRGLRLDPYRDTTFSAVDERRHDELRAMVAPGYGGKDVDDVHELIDEQVGKLVRLIESRYLSSEESFRPVDFARKAQFFTLDVISSLALGRSFGHLDADSDRFGYIATTETTIPFLVVLALLPWALSVTQSPWLRRFMPDTRNVQGVGDVMRIAHDAVAERYGENAPRRRDMLASFVAHGLGREDCEGEALVQILAGSDTTATAIRSTVLFVITNPHAYGRLQTEIDRAVREGRVSSPITDAEARRFEYLQAVIREGLRLWTPASGLLPKVSDRDEVVCGVNIPVGTNVAWAPWPVMRNQEIFGRDAELFRPERWLDVSEERWRLMDQTVMLDFKSGSRWECLGKNIAMIELNKVYVELFRRFDFTLVDPTNPWKVFNAAISIQTDMNVLIRRRDKTI